MLISAPNDSNAQILKSAVVRGGANQYVTDIAMLLNGDVTAWATASGEITI
jgi:hypothetical protein